MDNIISVDVEDWFHILDLDSSPNVTEWHALEPRVERNFQFLMHEFEKKNVKATLFILAWVAEKYPEMIKLAAELGHEIACHGYAHQLVYTLSPEEFREDITKAKNILEQITGQLVKGYRAPGFSITKDARWALEELVKAGFEYDSSIFPASRGHGGDDTAKMNPHIIRTASGPITEFPITVASLFGKKMCFFGGGYLRLFPYPLIRRMSEKVNQGDRPVVYYVHPREIDVDQPRMKMGMYRHFKSYVGLSSTTTKLRSIMEEQTLTTFSHWLSQHHNDIEMIE